MSKKQAAGWLPSVQADSRVTTTKSSSHKAMKPRSTSRATAPWRPLDDRGTTFAPEQDEGWDARQPDLMGRHAEYANRGGQVVANASRTPAWQVAIVVLTGTVLAAIALECLYWAQAIFLPVAMAGFLTFVLAPLASILQRKGLGRAPSVVLVVLLAVLVMGGIVWVVGAQARNMASEAPAYTENLTARLRSLRQLGQGPLARRLHGMVQEMAGALTSPPDGDESRRSRAGRGAAETPPQIVLAQDPPWLARLASLLGRLTEALGGLGMALVLLMFMLLNREDLRNRLIRLAGDSRIAATTRAFDEASQRISRFLVVQLIVNSSFGLVLMLGLLAIGIPYAFLWGFLGFVLRYLPYVGPWIAGVPLVLLSLAAFPGWTQPLLVIGLLAATEFVTSSIIEPRLFGRSIGVSEVALLVAAGFWAFFWGPIGLVLSSPFTVCLMVLGRYVPHLGFLEVLLGDAPALSPDVIYYQRLLARDQAEATELALAQAKATSPEAVCDDLLVRALNYAKRDRQRDDLTEADEQFVVQSLREMLEPLHACDSTPCLGGTPPLVGDAATLERPRILACPGHDEMDRVGLEILCSLLDGSKWQVELGGVGMLASELVARVAKTQPSVICIAAVPPGGLAHARYLCIRLSARFPEIRIIVGRWGLNSRVDSNRRALEEAGAHAVNATLAETRRQLASLLLISPSTPAANLPAAAGVTNALPPPAPAAQRA